MIPWLDENFVSLLNGLSRASILFVLAAGLALIFGLMDVLNLAHGALYLVGSYLAVQFAGGGGSFLTALVVAVLVGVVGGLFLMLALQPVSRRGHLDQVLLTLGLSLIISDVCTWIWGRGFFGVDAPSFASGSMQIIGHAYPTYRVALILVGFGVAIFLLLLLERTNFGATVRATVADRDMVAAMGVRVDRITASVFVLGSVLAIVGGVFGSVVFSVSPSTDDNVLVLALIVLAVGGVTSLKGALIAAVIIGQAEVLGVTLAPPGLAGFVLFGAMALVLAMRPQGLMGA